MGDGESKRRRAASELGMIGGLSGRVGTGRRLVHLSTHHILPHSSSLPHISYAPVIASALHPRSRNLHTICPRKPTPHTHPWTKRNNLSSRAYNRTHVSRNVQTSMTRHLPSSSKPWKGQTELGSKQSRISEPRITPICLRDTTHTHTHTQPPRPHHTHHAHAPTTHTH
jgi:hypothetical protein